MVYSYGVQRFTFATPTVSALLYTRMGICCNLFWCHSSTHIQIVSLQTSNVSKSSANYIYKKKVDLVCSMKYVKVLYGSHDPYSFFCLLTEESQHLKELMASLKAAYASQIMSISFYVNTVYLFKQLLILLLEWPVSSNLLETGATEK